VLTSCTSSSASTGSGRAWRTSFRRARTSSRPSGARQMSVLTPPSAGPPCRHHPLGVRTRRARRS
jgi:hypothetical protein